MPQRDTSGIGDRVPRDLIFADFEVAFNFVGMAENESDRAVAEQLLQRAEAMLKDIEGRFLRMTVAQREEFEPRCAELREAIDKARIDD
jgi:hypothetical protein